jgi:hypothetical protein
LLDFFGKGMLLAMYRTFILKTWVIFNVNQDLNLVMSLFTETRYKNGSLPCCRRVAG